MYFRHLRCPALTLRGHRRTPILFICCQSQTPLMPSTADLLRLTWLQYMKLCMETRGASFEPLQTHCQISEHTAPSSLPFVFSFDIVQPKLLFYRSIKKQILHTITQMPVLQKRRCMKTVVLLSEQPAVAKMCCKVLCFSYIVSSLISTN